MSEKLSDLVTLMARLRAENGCPWDKKQTHESLKPYLVEETYEVLEAIDNGLPGPLKEELGDLLLQILFHAQIASERSEFTFGQVAQHLAQKLIRRHPHVFDQDKGTALNHDHEVIRQWEDIKSQERQSTSKNPSLIDGIPRSSPALQRAYQIQKRVSRGGFDWTSPLPVFEKLKEEFDELFQAASQALKKTEASTGSEDRGLIQDEVEAEVGDVLFSMVNVARFLKINPEEALRKATNRFINRFQYLEAHAAGQQKPLNEFSEGELDHLWEEAKSRENQ